VGEGRGSSIAISLLSSILLSSQPLIHAFLSFQKCCFIYLFINIIFTANIYAIVFYGNLKILRKYYLQT